MTCAEHQRRFRNTHKEHLKAWRARPEQKTRTRANWYRKQYGITIEDYEKMLRSQGGVCAVCKTDNPNRKRRLHVDHDHATGKVRGILCHTCNLLVGLLENGIDPSQYLPKLHPSVLD